MVPLSQSNAGGNSEPIGRAFDAGGETRYPDLREGRIDSAPTFRRLESRSSNVEVRVSGLRGFFRRSTRLPGYAL